MQVCYDKDIINISVGKSLCLCCCVELLYECLSKTRTVYFKKSKKIFLVFELCGFKFFCIDGTLSGMLVNENNDPSPLEVDQSLFYFRQLLMGVQFLHDNNVLHLDIRDLNLKVFDEGRNIKLANFEYAMKMDDLHVSHRQFEILYTEFTAPEVTFHVISKKELLFSLFEILFL